MSFEVHEYEVKVFSHPKGMEDENERIRITLIRAGVLDGPDSPKRRRLRFFDAGKPLPSNSTNPSRFHFNFPLEVAPVVLDILRNEKPVFQDTLRGYVYVGTGAEPTGEEEAREPTEERT